ncbi:MAG: hypothetical protein K2N73_09940 [Lachnospiraceae bacterium]|nr:hypothetical protein [Lachnospiraceae bacterium]
MHRLPKRLLALTLALALTFGVIPVHSVKAAEQKKQTAVQDKEEAKKSESEESAEEEIRYERIDISTAEEFADFAANCYIDAWSRNKYVSLKADIDLSGVDFEVIPVFNGIFDGVGHTISGFDYLGDGYVVGLFRYVESQGVIQNLTLKGNIESENERECIGSFCGVNYGTIKNCTFQGTVSGRDTVGGIAGMNEGTGTITGCAVKGRITGYYSTGGIVGINHGALNYCSNRAGINDDSAWVEEDDEMGGLGILESLTNNDDNELYSGVDTGGVAGFSDGVISRCTNSGTVGYEHTGYNIGGIAGRQSGIVSLSTNNGTVYGRKDVGGIVGQMEPFIEIDEAESLRNAIDRLHDIIEKTINDMDAAKDVVKRDVDTMQSYADSAIDTGDALVTQLTDFVDENVDEVNAISGRMEHIIDLLPDILNNVSAAGDAMSRLNDVAKQLSNDLDVLGKLDDSQYSETDYSRITLLSTVGGEISTDSAEPQVNDTVTITVRPNDGYKLKDGSLKVTDAKGKKIAVTPVSGKSDQYTFIMTKSNVKITAEFVYKGTFLVKSTVGGKVTTTEAQEQVTFQAAASGGYTFNCFQVNGSVFKESEITLDKSAYIKEGTSVTVEAVFDKKSGAAHRITVDSGIGGTAYVTDRKNTAAAGETVTVHITASPGYEYSEMKISGGVDSTLSSTNVNERIFQMPDRDVEVEVLFRSKCESSSGKRIFEESNAGGSVTVRQGASSSQYQITIKPDKEHDVSESSALRFTKVTLSGTAGDFVEKTENLEGSQPTESQAEKQTESPTESFIESPAENPDLSAGTPDEGEAAQSSSVQDEEQSSESSSTEDADTVPPSSEDVNNSSTEAPDEGEGSGEDVQLSPGAGEGDNEEQTTVEQEEGVRADAVPAGDVRKDQLTYNADAGTYTYIVDLGSSPDTYRAYVTFVKKTASPGESGTSFNVTTASSTGGIVSVDKTSARAGEKVYATPVSNSGYVLTKILVNGESLTPESDGKRYSFTMTGRDSEVTAAFEPVDIILKSNLSGNAAYSGDAEGMVTVNVKPDAAYTVSSITVTDAGGKKLSVSKRQSGSYIYEFDITKMTKAPCTVNVSFKKQNKKQAVDTSKTNIDEAVEELAKASDNVQKSIDRIKDIIKKPDGSYKSWDELSSSEQDAVVAEVLNLLEYLGDMSAAASSILSSLTTLYNILSPYMTDAANAAKKDIEKATDHIHSILDSLKAANNGVKGIVNYMNAQPDIRFAKLGDGFDITKENFHDQLKGLSDSIRVLSDNASGYSDIINDDLRAVNDQLNVVFNLLADRMVDIESLSIEELYEDVDDTNIESITTGRADACFNKGIVKGDINVGGIAGSMAIDDEDPEDSAAGTIEYQIGRRFITKCLVTDSVNEGYITAKKNGAGGICGYMNHGIIVDSESYGSVESTEGDYVGGICGESLTIIKRCYALCSVTGNKNVGGIAGYAETLKNCYSMADVHAENGRAGAIAGQIAGYEEVDADAADEEPKVAGNFYVGENIHGIDNISYIGVAEPIAYSDLLTVEQLPTQFWHLKVIYKVDDMYLGSEEVRYGTKLDHLNYPQIPGKEGFYGVWPDVSDKTMGGTFVVEGTYKDNVTVVQSDGDADAMQDGQRQKPYALVEDIFTEDTILSVKLSDMEPPEEARGRQNIVYEVILENSGIQETDAFALRILNPYENAVVYGYKDGRWTELENKSRGQYLQVAMTGTREYFCVVEKNSNLVILIVCAAAASAAIVVLIVVGKKRSSRRKRKQERE